jgi:hypothetical protein
MIEEVKSQSYSGVLCRSCRQPIPLPTVVRASSAAANEEREEARVFNLRCRACDKERPYRRSDVTIFEGTPKLRTTPRPPSSLHAKKLTRAASA